MAMDVHDAGGSVKTEKRYCLWQLPLLLEIATQQQQLQEQEEAASKGQASPASAGGTTSCGNTSSSSVDGVTSNDGGECSPPRVTNPQLAQQLAFQCRIGDGEMEALHVRLVYYHHSIGLCYLT
jgi:hypothetical protein